MLTLYLFNFLLLLLINHYYCCYYCCYYFFSLFLFFNILLIGIKGCSGLSGLLNDLVLHRQLSKRLMLLRAFVFLIVGFPKLVLYVFLFLTLLELGYVQITFCLIVLYQVIRSFIQTLTWVHNEQRFLITE